MLINITKKHVFYSIFSKRKNDPLGSTRLYCQTSDYIIFDITVLVILYLLKHEYVWKENSWRLTAQIDENRNKKIAKNKINVIAKFCIDQLFRYNIDG